MDPDSSEGFNGNKGAHCPHRKTGRERSSGILQDLREGRGMVGEKTTKDKIPDGLK